MHINSKFDQSCQNSISSSIYLIIIYVCAQAKLKWLYACTPGNKLCAGVIADRFGSKTSESECSFHFGIILFTEKWCELQ